MRGVRGEMPEKGAELFRVILNENGFFDAPLFAGFFYVFHGVAGS